MHKMFIYNSTCFSKKKYPLSSQIWKQVSLMELMFFPHKNTDFYILLCDSVNIHTFEIKK